MREPAGDLGAGLPASLGPQGLWRGAREGGGRGRPLGSSGLLSRQTLVWLEEEKRGVRGLRLTWASFTGQNRGFLSGGLGLRAHRRKGAAK